MIYRKCNYETPHPYGASRSKSKGSLISMGEHTIACKQRQRNNQTTMQSFLLKTGQHKKAHKNTFYSSSGLTNALISWIVADNILFRGIKTPAFKRLLHVAAILEGKASKDCIRRQAASKEIRSKAAAAKKVLRQELQENRSRVTISLDGWTSPNGYAFVGIVVHYISNDFKIHREVLDFKILEGSHTGELQSLYGGLSSGTAYQTRYVTNNSSSKNCS